MLSCGEVACFGEMFGTTTDKSHFKVALFDEMFGTTMDIGYVYMLSGSFR